MKNKTEKLTRNLMILSVGPLLVFGVIVIIITSVIIYNSLENEVSYGLEILADSVYKTYDLVYPGDFTISEDERIIKGNKNIENNFEIIDSVKETSGAEITLFGSNKRHITTIKNADGKRAIGTYVSEKVNKKVLIEGKEYFSPNVMVNDSAYFGYYMPLRDSGSNIIGMLFTGKPRSLVAKEISKNILMVCLLMLLIMAVAVLITVHYGKNIIYSLSKTEKFLGDIAKGDLTAKIDAHILERQDEIGEMGRFLVMIQKSIADLVGKDHLTGLNNRRSCDVVLESIVKKSLKEDTIFSVAIGDIDFFKRVNDTYGHRAGDEVLKYIANYIIENVERKGFVFRWGGEEFLIIYENMDIEESYEHLKRLKDNIQSSCIVWNDEKINIAMTFGLADCTEEKDIEKLIQLADSKLYLGKTAGRDQIVYRCYD